MTFQSMKKKKKKRKEDSERKRDEPGRLWDTDAGWRTGHWEIQTVDGQAVTEGGSGCCQLRLGLL